MTSKKRKKKLVELALFAPSTLRFLKKFYKYGKKKGWFPELPGDLKEKLKKTLEKEEALSLKDRVKKEPARKRAEKLNKELGKWMRENKKIPDEELLRELLDFVGRYNEQNKQEISKDILMAGEHSSKTLARFTQGRHVGCLASSTAMGEMARTMNFKVQYYRIGAGGTYKTPSGEDGKLGEDHAYLTIDGQRYDPMLGEIGGKHKGEKETREERAVTIWGGHGVWLGQIERYEQEIKAYNLVLEINPTCAEAWCNMGEAYDDKEEYDKAIECYEKAVKFFKEQEKTKHAQKIKDKLEKAKRKKAFS